MSDAFFTELLERVPRAWLEVAVAVISRGTLIRHAGGFLSVSTGSLPQAVGLSSLRGLLVTTVRLAPLLLTGFDTAGLTTVTLPAVAVATYIEDRVAAGSPTVTWTESRFRYGWIFGLGSCTLSRCIKMIMTGRMTGAFGADDVGAAPSAKVQKTTISDDR